MNSSVVGIDLGEKESVATYLLPDGTEKDQFTFTMDLMGYKTFSEKIPRDVRIAFEASGSAYSVDRNLRNLGYSDITVAHPKELSWIIKSKKKNDRVDSVKLAKLHLVDMIPESHLLGDDARIFRDILIQRVKLGKAIASTKNGIIGYLKREGLYDSLPKTNDNFSKKRRTAMNRISFGNQKDLVLRAMLDRLSFYEQQAFTMEMEMRKNAKVSDDVRLLISIPGIDFYLASLLSSYIGDIKRFQSSDKLASFFGVVPANRDSSSIKRRGHMSKEGATTSRWALSLAVDTVILRNKPLKEYYASVKKRKGSGKFAHVSTMRKLVRMIFVMLTERKKWKYEITSLTEDKTSRLEEV